MADHGGVLMDEPQLPEGLADRIDVLRGREYDVAALPGGLTNKNLKVTTDEGAYVLRLSDEASGALAIDRDHEYANSVIAARSGVGAPVIQRLPEAGVVVIGFLEGQTLADGDFARPGVVERVALAVRQLHQGEPFVNVFDMFEIQRRYLDLVTTRGYRLPGDYHAYAGQVDRIRDALATRAEPRVACNNDLLAANFIDAGDRMFIIDYEYAGNNDPCFELGNIWSECHLTDDQLETLVATYYGRPFRNRVARARLQGLMSQYGWTLWASIQDGQSDLDFDFWSWGMEKYERAVATFNSAGFDDLLDEVQRPD